jgi:beta-ribofuranosylaminobenzene 5'-phosphate synthase
VRTREGIAATLVRVRASARLHLGFLDLNGGLGRRFGSLGMALDHPSIELGLSNAQELEVEGTEPDRLRRYAEEAVRFLGVPARGRIVLRSSIPAHAGFGSGTQLALSGAAALAGLHGVPFDAGRAAAALDRGNRSGIGLAAFVRGGLVLDGGRGADDRLPPIIARLPIPPSWRVVLVLDTGFEGIHGEAEAEAFRGLPPFPQAYAAHLCHLTLMRILPAAANGDVRAFGEGIAEVQRFVGDHFAEAQGGRFTSPCVASVLSACEAMGVAGVGQSSWGPTGFAIVGSQQEAESLVATLTARLLPDNIALMIVKGRNGGARITGPSTGGTPQRVRP